MFKLQVSTEGVGIDPFPEIETDREA